jgi:hypothetical protein
VPREDERRPAGLGPGDRADDSPRLGAVDLLAGRVGCRGSGGQVDRPAVDLAAQRRQLTGDQVLDLGLRVAAAHRRDGDGAPQQVDRPPLVDGGEDLGLDLGHRGHERSLARARTHDGPRPGQGRGPRRADRQ